MNIGKTSVFILKYTQKALTNPKIPTAVIVLGGGGGGVGITSSLSSSLSLRHVLVLCRLVNEQNLMYFSVKVDYLKECVFWPGDCQCTGEGGSCGVCPCPEDQVCVPVVTMVVFVATILRSTVIVPIDFMHCYRSFMPLSRNRFLLPSKPKIIASY